MNIYSVIYFKSKHYDVESSVSYVVQVQANSYKDAKSKFQEDYEGYFLWSIEEEEVTCK